MTEFFASQTGLPRYVLFADETRSYPVLRRAFREHVIAQEEACEAAAEVITTLQMGLNDPTKPLATMLLVGPTGVGKTETAKAIAKQLFGRADRMIRLDMSEFADPFSVARLLGDRYRPDGELTRRVREHPFSVVLLDEIEKADPAIFDALLQVLGEGRLTNNAGMTTDFCNTIVLMTSNLGVRDRERSLGYGYPGGETERTADAVHYRRAAEEFFRPEFFNRIDRVVAYARLGREAITPLVRRILEELLSRRGLRRSGVVVEVEPQLTDLLIEQGFEPQYGARSLRRALEQRLTAPLARHLAAHVSHAGTAVVQLYVAGTEIGMDVWHLRDHPLDPRLEVDDARAPGLPDRYQQLRERFEELSADPRARALDARRRELLRETASMDEANASPEPSLELEDLLAFGDAKHELERDLAEFYDEYLEPFDLVETLHIEHEHQGWDTRDRLGSSGDIPVPRRLDFRGAEGLRALTGLETRFSMLRYRLATAERPPQRLILRVLPQSAALDSVEWIDELGRALARRALATLTGCWLRDPAGWQSAPLEDWDSSRHDGLALELVGREIRPLLEGDVGMHVSARHQGADLALGIARVELLAPEAQAGARDLLTASDEAFAEFERARRSGESVDNPRPALPVASRFLDREGFDCRSGLRSNSRHRREHYAAAYVRRLDRLDPTADEDGEGAS